MSQSQCLLLVSLQPFPVSTSPAVPMPRLAFTHLPPYNPDGCGHPQGLPVDPVLCITHAQLLLFLPDATV